MIFSFSMKLISHCSTPFYSYLFYHLSLSLSRIQKIIQITDLSSFTFLFTLLSLFSISLLFLIFIKKVKDRLRKVHILYSCDIAKYINCLNSKKEFDLYKSVKNVKNIKVKQILKLIN